MTFKDMATANGMICLMATLFGANIAKRGRERVKSVSHVMKKWNAANVSCASFNDGSEKIALFVKTCCITSLAPDLVPTSGTYDSDGC